jgi:hypothetical protein
MKAKIMILFTSLGLMDFRKNRAHLLFFLLLLTGCTEALEESSQGLSEYDLTLKASFIIPSNGDLSLYMHHPDSTWVLAVNHSTSELFVYDYVENKIIHTRSLKQDPDLDPGRVYSLGFYKRGYYLLGSSGLFLFDSNYEPAKVWKRKMTRYNDVLPRPSFVIQENGQDVLVAQYESYLPKERRDLNPKENRDYFKFLSLIRLDTNSDSLLITPIASYPKSSEISKSIGSQGLRFTVFNKTIHVVFRTEPKFWSISKPFLNPNNYTELPMHLLDGDNHYLMTSEEQGPDAWRTLAENPGFHNLHVDRVSGEHYFEYSPAFDEEHWPSIYKGQLHWLDENINLYSKYRLVKYDRQLAKAYELDTKDDAISAGWIQFIHDGQFFVGSPNEPEMGTEFHIYTIEVEPQR